MATQWVLGKVSDALAPTVSGAVAGAGSFVGGAVGAVGSSINGVGDGINNSIRRYGDGTKDYGNAIKDWTQADGVRAATASNPLGLSAGVTGGKRQVTAPQVYRAPHRTTPSKTLMTTSKTAVPQKKSDVGTPRKALPAPGPKANGAMRATPASAPKSTAPNPGALRKKPVGNASTAAGAVKQSPAVKKPTSVKPSTASAPKTTTAGRPKAQGSSVAAANPLGLSF